MPHFVSTPLDRKKGLLCNMNASCNRDQPRFALKFELFVIFSELRDHARWNPIAHLPHPAILVNIGLSPVFDVAQ